MQLGGFGKRRWGGPQRLFSAILLYKAADMSIANNTSTVVTFDAEVYNTIGGGVHSVSTNTSRIYVPPGASWVRFWASAYWTANATGVRRIRLKSTNFVTSTSGITVGQTLALMVGSSVSNHGQMVSSPPINVKGDGTEYMEFEVYQTSGGALNLICGNFQNSSGFGMEVLA